MATAELTLKRKARNVLRSSHGKFTREMLMAHQVKVIKPKAHVVKLQEKNCPPEQWIRYIPCEIPWDNYRSHW